MDVVRLNGGTNRGVRREVFSRGHSSHKYGMYHCMNIFLG